MLTLGPYICFPTTILLNTERLANFHGHLKSGSMLTSMSLEIIRRVSSKIFIGGISGFTTTYGLTSHHYIGYKLAIQKPYTRRGYQFFVTTNKMKVFPSFSSREETQLIQFGRSSHSIWSLARSVAILPCSGY